MTGYGSTFARVYNEHWAGFSKQAAPAIHDYYVTRFSGMPTTTASITTPSAAGGKPPILDLCCGTGQAAAYFLERGWQVTGLDLSPDMLDHARANNAAYLENGFARFVQGDAADFSFEQQFGLVISLYDALNHLPDSPSLRSCFQCVRRVLQDGGLFVFDLNTRAGVSRWNHIQITDNENMMLINRGIYDGGDHATMSITGFMREADGRYTRFVEVAHNTLFALDDVRSWLFEAGFKHVHFARGSDLGTPVDQPETLERAWVLAW